LAEKRAEKYAALSEDAELYLSPENAALFSGGIEGARAS